MKIRKATMKDMKNIQGLNKALFDKEYKEYDKLLDLGWTYGKKGKDFFREALTKSNSCVFVAVDDGAPKGVPPAQTASADADKVGKIVGYLSGEITKGEDYRKLPKMVELSGIFVLDEYRSKGIGKKLYAELVKWAKGKDVKRIKVETAPQNDKGIKYYEGIGFEGFTITLERAI